MANDKDRYQIFGSYPKFPDTRKEFEEQFWTGERKQLSGSTFNIGGGRVRNRRRTFFPNFIIYSTSFTSIILYDCEILKDVELIDCRCIGCKFPPKKDWIKLGIKVE